MKGNIDIHTLKELKSMAKPPHDVKVMMEAVYILFYDKVPTWKESHNLLSNDRNLKEMIDEYDSSKVTASMKEKLKFIVERPDFTVDVMKSKSLATAELTEWVIGTYNSC